MSNIELTGMLNRWRAGDRACEAQLIAIIYPVLRAFAHKQLASKRGLTMQPTELAHEAYFKLAGQREVDWKNRAHFFAIASQAVRRVVIDYLRERSAQKRGGDEIVVSIDHLLDAEQPIINGPVDWLRIDHVLNELEAVNEQGARIIELRYFAGLSLEETALAMDMSSATIARRWRSARAWLHGRLEGQI
jgi:RNA polymerase sigma factor (TIGR02999 family)